MTAMTSSLSKSPVHFNQPVAPSKRLLLPTQNIAFGAKQNVSQEEHALIQNAYPEDPRAEMIANCFSGIGIITSGVKDLFKHLAHNADNQVAFFIGRSGDITTQFKLQRYTWLNPYTPNTIDADIDTRQVKTEKGYTREVTRLQYKTPSQNIRHGGKEHEAIRSAFPTTAVPENCFVQRWYDGTRDIAHLALRSLIENYRSSVHLLVNKREVPKVLAYVNMLNTSQNKDPDLLYSTELRNVGRKVAVRVNANTTRMKDYFPIDV